MAWHIRVLRGYSGVTERNRLEAMGAVGKVLVMWHET
jgi:hypothetical protein